MKKLLFLISFLTILGGANSVKAYKLYADISKITTRDGTNATWDGETNTITWIGQTNNMVSDFDFPAGDYSTYTKICVAISNLDNAIGVRVQICAGSKEVAKPVNGNGTTEILLSSFGFTEDEIKDVKWIRLLGSGYYDGESHTINAENPASAKIDKAYLEKPTTLVFDDSGKAYIDWTDISVSGATLTYDDQTGIVTSTGTSGEINITFDKAYDLSSIKKWTASMTGTDIVWHWKLLGATHESGGKTVELDMYSGEFARDFPGSLVNPDFSAVTGITMYPDKEGTLNFTEDGMYITCNTITATRNPEVEEILLKNLPWIEISTGDAKTPDWNMDGENDTYYGNYSGDATHYVDLTDYGELRIYCNSSSDGFRAFFIKSDGSGTNQIHTTTAVWNGTAKYYSLDLSTIAKWNGKVALKCIKSEASWETQYPQGHKITNIKVTPSQYVLTGSGLFTSSTNAVFSDAAATLIDATGITAATTLSALANSNCIVLGNANVTTTNGLKCVGTTIADFALTDGGGTFRTTEDYDATNVSYNRSFTVGQASTICLPFELSKEEAHAAGTFYTLTSYAGGTLTFTEIGENEGTTAYQPYLFKAAKSSPFSSDLTSKTITASVGADLTTTAGDATMTGTMAHQSVNGKYGWNSTNGVFSKATSDAVTIDPFRAYITVSGGGSSRMTALFVENSATGINEVSEAQNFQHVDGKVLENGRIVIFKNGMKYNAAGQQIK